MLRAQDVEQFIKEEPFWYSTIELAPGVLTPGFNIPSVGAYACRSKSQPA
jgi:hypothetical protein